MLARIFAGPVRFYLPTGTRVGVALLNDTAPARRMVTTVTKEIREKHITDIRRSETDGAMVVHFRGSYNEVPATFVARLADLVRV